LIEAQLAKMSAFMDDLKRRGEETLRLALSEVHVID
jgi:hypothetical protein